MKTTLILSATIIILAALALSHASETDARLQYIGECVDAMASADHHRGDHREQWSAYSDTCNDQYNPTK